LQLAIRCYPCRLWVISDRGGRRHAPVHVRFAPFASLFDHLVHAGKQLRRHVETKRSRGLEIKLRLIPLACLRGREASWVE
jgi:hypothetical protein